MDASPPQNPPRDRTPSGTSAARLGVVEGGRAGARPARRDPLTGCGALLAAAQAGDKRAYAELLARCQDWLRPYLARRLAPDLAEEACQEVLLAVHLKRHTYDPSRPFAPWLASIARYKWIDRVRAIYRAPGQDALTDEAGRTESHEGAVLSAVLTERLMAHLPPRQAEALRLVKIEGLSVEEASLRSGQSASLVKVNVHRAKKAMVRRLERAGE